MSPVVSGEMSGGCPSDRLVSAAFVYSQATHIRLTAGFPNMAGPACNHDDPEASRWRHNRGRKPPQPFLFIKRYVPNVHHTENKDTQEQFKEEGEKKQATKVAGSATYKQYETVAF